MLFKSLTAIAMGLMLMSAGAAYAQEACEGADTELTEARQQEYAQLIVDAIGEGLQLSDVEIDAFLESGTWSAVQGSMPTADTAMFVFEDVDGTKAFRDVWGGMADPSDRTELIQWAEGLGAPEDFAACFADVTIDPPMSFGFTFDVTFSDAALAALAEQDEHIVAMAAYYGNPTPEAEEHANDIGLIDLGMENVEAPGEPGSITITGETVDTGRLEWTQGEATVNVNIASARASNPDNILACDFIEGGIAEVANVSITLHCSLIEEQPDTEVKP